VDGGRRRVGIAPRAPRAPHSTSRVDARLARAIAIVATRARRRGDARARRRGAIDAARARSNAG